MDMYSNIEASDLLTRSTVSQMCDEHGLSVEDFEADRGEQIKVTVRASELSNWLGY